MARRWRKKPIEVEAFRYAIEEIPAWFAEARDTGIVRGFDPLVIHTATGEATANGGDWIIRSPSGELYPCSDEDFEAIYDEVT